MTKKLNIAAAVLLPLMALGSLNFFDVFGRVQGKNIENHIKEGLLNQKTVALSNLIQNMTIFCILPPYATSESIQSNLSEQQRNYINNRTAFPFSLDDGVWWLVILNKDENIELYKMTMETIRPDFKKGKCLNQKEAIVVASRSSTYGQHKSIYFNFGKGD